jgi:hypothetical protein
MAHKPVDGQEMAVGLPGIDEEDVDPGRVAVHGADSSDQAWPSQSSTAVPTTAVHADVDAQETPTRPEAYRAVALPAPPTPPAPVPKACGVSHDPFFHTKALPVLSTMAQNLFDVHDTAASREPGWPLPGSAGLTGSAAAGIKATGVIQLVPSPLETNPEPSTMAQKGPPMQVIAGRIGDGRESAGGGK